jgi:hypothetical protein
MQVFWIFF